MTEKFKSNQGQTIIEFAFIMVLLVALILGIMEFGIVLYNQAILTDACRQGARMGVVFRADTTTFLPAYATADEIKTVIDNYLQNRIVTFGAPFDVQTDVTVNYSSDPYPAVHGEELTVQVNFTHTYLALPNFWQVGVKKNKKIGTINLSSRSAMRVE